MRPSRHVMLFAAAIASASFHARAQQLMPATTVNLNTFVALREIAAGAVVGDDKVVLLIRDQGLTGRSAILLEVDAEGANPQWTDLEAPAGSLVMAGKFVAALAPIANGVRLLHPAADGIHSTELQGLTAFAVGMESRLVRVLHSGEVAVQDIGAGEISAPRLLPMAAVFNPRPACTDCASAKFLITGTYILCPLPGERMAVIQRSSANLKILDLKNARVELTADLQGEDITRGKAMFDTHLEKIRARGDEPPNPHVIVSGASNSSGELFLLAGPVAFAEGVRVLRVNSKGAVVGALRLALPGFQLQYGSPAFLGANGDRLYLITSRGWMNIYRIPNVPSQLAQYHAASH